MRRANLSKHLCGLFICICVISLFPVFPSAADAATVAHFAGKAPATASLGWTGTGNLITAREYHTATLLASGQVLVAGGYNGRVLASSEIYNPSTGAWTGTGNLATAREYHTATLLASGSVLVTGGYNAGALASSEIYNPSTGVWAGTGSLATARYYHTATLLPSGKVLVTGGQDAYGDVLIACEIYNPSNGTWTATGSLVTARQYHTATLLANGQVLVAGGQDAYGNVLLDCEIYNPSTGAWTETGNLVTARAYHTATLLAGGDVLAAGGYNAGFLSSSEIYNPSTGAWTATGSPITAREYHTATLLPNGDVLVAGGDDANVLSDCEVYDPSTGAWAETGSLITARDYQTATLLLGGQVLVAGGYNGNVLSSSEIYDSSDTAPGAPTGVSAKPGNAQATVSFTPPELDGGSAITGYTVTSNPGGITAKGLESPIIVSGLTNGTAYTFTVTATNAIGTGPASAPSNKVTPATVPGAPTGVSATAGDAQAIVSFTAPASSGGYPITGYTVKSTPGGIKAEGHASPITVKHLINGTNYTFTVTATNRIGTGPASSPSNSVKPLGAPGAPTKVSATAGNAEATVSFKLPPDDGSTITGYTVTSKPGGITAQGVGSPITVTGLTNGTAYTFTVTATNAIGTGPASSASNRVTPCTAPGTPLDVTAEPGNAEAKVSFSAPASNGGSPITSYTVTSSAGQTGKGHASPITVKGLINGTAYTFTVTATNRAGTGPASSVSNSVTPSK
jgi:N-acetylneuraminic acid mutarotase